MIEHSEPDTPAQRVYDAFGGPMEVHREAGIPRPEVYRWRYFIDRETGTKRGLVPSKHHRAILDAAKRLRLRLKPADLMEGPL